MKNEKVYYCPLCKQKMFRSDIVGEVYYSCSLCDSFIKVSQETKEKEFDGVGIS